MNSGHFHLLGWVRRRALQARLAGLMLVILLVSIWTLGWYSGSTLRDDYQRTLGEQQFSLVSLLAAEVDNELFNAVTVLQRAATRIYPETIDDPAALQGALESLPVFQGMFEGGTFITDSRGVVVAGVPVSLGRQGLDYSDRDYVAGVLSGGKPVIGRPRMGARLQLPALGIGVPVRDASRKVVGVLVGVINLQTARFLQTIESSRYAKAGHYLLVAGGSRQIVAATEKFRVMEDLPAPGVNPFVDKFIAGYEGIEEFVNPIGVEVLTAVKQIPTAGWYAAVSMPTAEAYAPIRRLQFQILVATIVLTLVTGALIWWSLSRLLAPLERTADSLSDLAEGKRALGPLTPLVQAGEDEIGRLVRGFNLLLVELGRRQKSLSESNDIYQAVFRTSPDALSLTKLETGRYMEINDGFTHTFGWSRDEVVGKTSADLGIWYDWTSRAALIQTMRERGHCDNFEAEFLTRDGRVVSSLVSARTLMVRGEKCMLAVTHDFSARKAALDQVRHLAYTDTLTGLPNRLMFMERLAQVQAAGLQTRSLSALINVDLDDFKTVNDALGHERGDELLKIIAEQLRASVRPGDVIARLGGDEFVILLDQLGTEVDAANAEATRLAQILLEKLREPVTLGGNLHHRTASIGVALLGERSENPAEPLRRVEMAMYQAKAAGRNTVCLFDAKMQTQVSSRMDLDGRLREALRLKRFVLHYQPQVNDRGVTIGVEGLVRWDDPTRGLVPPGEFIALMEENGLILLLGEWVIETACQQLVRWASNPELSHLTIAVNVSASQFHQSDFTDKVIAALDRTGANPSLLKLELTESLLVTQMEWVVAKMSRLKLRGVRFSLDDFGTGFSSLYYLKRLPLSQLKIDQSFVSNILLDPNDQAIASMVVALGASLGLDVIAEGVETSAQRDALLALGCKLYQGYLFGRPAPVEEVEAAIRSGSR